MKKGLSAAYIFLIVIGIISFIIIILFTNTNNNSDSQSYTPPENIIKNDEPVQNQYIFSFYLNKTGEPVDGELIADGMSLGFTENGNISIPDLNPIPDNFSFNGVYNNIIFNLTYDFPKDYKDYSSYPFIVTEYDLFYSSLYNRYIPLKENDSFPKTQKLHWSHMPLIYKFNGTRCQGDRYDKLIYAFNEFKTETNGSVYFIEGNYSQTPDIIINCIQYSGTTTYEGDYSYETLGEGSLSAYMGNIIIQGTVNLYSTTASNGYFPFMEIHEILHTFNYSHVNEVSSIMYPYANTHSRYAYDNRDIFGSPHIDNDIVKELDEIYGNSSN